MSEGAAGAGSHTAGLLGRTAELDRLNTFVAGLAAGGGGTLMLSGDAGAGKSVLLDVAAHLARSAGTRVVRAAGVQFEAGLGFSGLNQVLIGLPDELAGLEPAQREALAVATGFVAGPAPDRLLVVTAAATLLRRLGGASGALVIIDDLHWVDRSSAAVLSLVARRLAGSRTGLLVAARAGSPSFFEAAGLLVVTVPPLGEQASAAVLQRRFPQIADGVRARLLTEAQGNPLALLELPVALSDSQRSAERPLPDVLRLTARLHALFAGRLGGLPEPARNWLLCAALQGDPAFGWLGPDDEWQEAPARRCKAEQAGLVTRGPSSGLFGFRHPLIRSAVVQAATADQRRVAHRTLARLLAADDQPDRSAWHLAEAAAAPDEKVAVQLEDATRRILGRGDPVTAVRFLVRAADLSPDGPDRGRRLTEAAYIGAAAAGQLRDLGALLDRAAEADPSGSATLHAAAAAAYRLIAGDGDVDTAHRIVIGALAARPAGSGVGGEPVGEALHTLVHLCSIGGRADLWTAVSAQLDRLGGELPVLLRLVTSSYGDPATTSPALIAELSRLIGELPDEADPSRITRIGMAALNLDRMAECRPALRRVVDAGRAGGVIAPAVIALTQLALDDLGTGRWYEADQLLDESLKLCQDNGYRFMEWAARSVRAVLAVQRGDDEVARGEIEDVIGWATPRGALGVVAAARHGAVLMAVGRADFEEAYRLATAISPAGRIGPYSPHALRVGRDLVEAAVRIGRHDEAAAHARAIQASGIAALSPRMALTSGTAVAIAEPDHDRAVALFTAALADAAAERWPFDYARSQLAYGERLRRSRSTSEARDQLRAALATFERLGSRPWAARTAAQLRSTGQPAGRGSVSPAKTLTPQEVQVARLAAEGLTNKQIGERLFLSHRTVSDHLYRIFPKLGVSSRAALRDALQAISASTP